MSGFMLAWVTSAIVGAFFALAIAVFWRRLPSGDSRVSELNAWGDALQIGLFGGGVIGVLVFLVWAAVLWWRG